MPSAIAVRGYWPSTLKSRMSCHACQPLQCERAQGLDRSDRGELAAMVLQGIGGMRELAGRQYIDVFGKMSRGHG